MVGVCIASTNHEEGILLPKYRDRNGKCILLLFESIRVRGRCYSADRRVETWNHRAGLFHLVFVSARLGTCWGTFESPAFEIRKKTFNKLHKNGFAKIGSAETDLVWVKRGFEEGLLKANSPFF